MTNIQLALLKKCTAQDIHGFAKEQEDENDASESVRKGGRVKVPERLQAVDPNDDRGQLQARAKALLTRFAAEEAEARDSEGEEEPGEGINQA